MANKVITMHLIRTIIQSLERGYSLRHISRELKLSRQAVTLYASRLQNCNYSLTELRQLDDASLALIVYSSQDSPASKEDPRKAYFISRIPYFLSELKRTGVTRLLLWQEYYKENQQGYAYTQFCVLLSQHQKIQDVSMHLEYKPAEVMMVDFAGDKISYTDKDTRQIIECPVFVCILPYSGFSYAVALPDASIPQVVKALNQCLQYFQGVPFSLKTDNMKQIVSKSCRYEPLFTEVMQQWALHYNIDLVAARVCKPKDKAAVENEVKLVYQRLYAPLRHELFFSLEQVNAAFNKQLLWHHDQLFQRKNYSRKDLFESQEKKLLLPLPAGIYELKHSVVAKVQKNCHITLGEDWHHYSVPYQHIGKEVKAVYDTDIVEVFLQHQRIALHKRSYKPHGYTTAKEHMPRGHQHYFEQKGWTPQYFLGQAEQAGPCSYQYMQGALNNRRFTEQTYNTCRGLLRLAREYGADRFEAACKRALPGATFGYRIIHNILMGNLDKEPPAQGDLFQIPVHDNLRGPEAYQ
jgi:transposase